MSLQQQDEPQNHSSLNHWPRLILPVLVLVGGVSTMMKLLTTHAASPSSTRTVPSSGHYHFVKDSAQDGISFQIRNEKTILNVKLCGVIAPPGNTAQNYLNQLISTANGHIILASAHSDEAGDTVTEIFLPTDSDNEEIYLNSQMLADGMAYVDETTLKFCQNRRVLRATAAIAKENAIGIWAQPSERQTQVESSNQLSKY